MFPSVVAAAVLAVPSPLTIGSPAPKFDVTGFVKGEPFAELAPGTVFVVEFSGTECAPCVKAMPVLTALQKKHPDVVFVSIYGEPEKAVREAIAKHAAAIGFRVARERKGAMSRSWMRAAARDGIPAVFVVKDGRIAWIGSPFDLAEPLERILAGTYDPRFDAVRLRVEAAVSRRDDAEMAQIERSRKFNDPFNALIEAKRWDDALKAIDEFAAGCPDSAFWRYHNDTLRLTVLTSDPAAEERAIALAVRLAADARHDGYPNHGQRLRSIGSELVFRGVLPPNPRFLDLGIVLGRMGEDAAASLIDPGERGYLVAQAKELVAEAHHAAGRRDKALAGLREVVALIPAIPVPNRRDPDSHRRQMGQYEKAVTARLAGYEKAAPPGK